MGTIIQQQKEYFNTNATKPISFRIGQLKKLKTVLKNYEEELSGAIFRDFQKGGFNTFLTEFSGLYVELNQAIKNLGRWAKIRRVRTNLLNFPCGSYIMPEPLGVCLIIGAWNYPINLSIAPAIAAIAAGNTIIMKPSELTSHTSATLAKMIGENFDPAYFAVVEGGIKETTALLEQKFDKIFFTGSPAVGKIVYQAAAKNLIPVSLELGGKSPMVIAADAKIEICVKRLVWGKFLNAGQTCIAPDYLLLHKKIEKPFLEALRKEILAAKFSLENNNYNQIINERNFDRLVSLIRPEKVFLGGDYDRSIRFIAPTVMINISEDDKVMEEEIFGPILPVISYEDTDAAIKLIRTKSKPLAFYLFTESHALRKKIFSEISFGGGAVNDVLMHFSNDKLPFGGVGYSGMGSYHGEAGFKTFSHEKSFIQKPTLFEFPIKYFPYNNWKLPVIRWIVGG
jgi:aldehyde dehydrogenase (NAD+)